MPRPGLSREALLHPRSVAGRFAPPLALMALIFAFSAQPDLNSGLGVVDLVGRKLIHAIDYGVLFLLWLRALGWRAPAAAALVTVLYAASDEYHQTFVEGRHGTATDVAIDAAGVAVAWAVSRGGRRWRPEPTGPEGPQAG